MFAIVEIGGKQYKVEKGKSIEIEKITEKTDAVITLSKVLFINNDKESIIGTPVIEGAGVMAKVIKEKKDDKIIIYKKHAKKRYERKRGHRQTYTVIEITEIKESGVKAKVEKAPEEKAEKETKTAPKEAKKATTEKPAVKKTRKTTKA